MHIDLIQAGETILVMQRLFAHMQVRCSAYSASLLALENTSIVVVVVNVGGGHLPAGATHWVDKG